WVSEGSAARRIAAAPETYPVANDVPNHALRGKLLAAAEATPPPGANSVRHFPKFDDDNARSLTGAVVESSPDARTTIASNVTPPVVWLPAGAVRAGAASSRAAMVPVRPLATRRLTKSAGAALASPPPGLGSTTAGAVAFCMIQLRPRSTTAPG